MDSGQIKIISAAVLVVVAVVLVWVAVRRTRTEPRRLSNGILIGLAAVSAAEALSAVGVTGANTVFVLLGLLIVLSPLLVLVLAILLIMNGSQMLRRESRSLGNLLSLLLGLGLLGLAAMPIIVLVAGGGGFGLAITAGFIAVAGYFGFLLLNFLIYAQIYARLVRRAPVDWVVVLGSGLGEGGRVPPLLAARVRTGLAEAARRRAAVVVMSGGKGDDEIRAEADAMADWALAQGADPRHLLTEDRSRNTEQNLRFSADLLREWRPALTAGPGEPIAPNTPAPPAAPAAEVPVLRREHAPSGLAPGLIVTSNYHAMRAAILARRLGLPAQAVGAPTADYYWPSAVLREFVAVLAEHRWRHLVLSVLIAAPLPLLVLFAH